MNISLQKLLLKMEEELRLAKGAGTEAVLREKIHSIKTLCELVLDEPAQSGYGSDPSPGQRGQQPIPAQPSYTQQQAFIPSAQQPSQLMPQPKKLQMEDDANGDSLFDF